MEQGNAVAVAGLEGGRGRGREGKKGREGGEVRENLFVKFESLFNFGGSVRPKSKS